MGQQVGGDVLAAHAVGVGAGQSLVDDGAHLVEVHGELLGHRVADQHATGKAQIPLALGDLGHVGSVLGGVVHAEAALAAVEGGEVAGLEAQNGNAHGLQILQSQADVQNHLGARADHGHRGVGQLLQVGADVHGGFGAAMYAADAAGGKELDASQAGQNHGGSYGGGAGAALGQNDGQVTTAYLHNAFALAHQLQLPGRQAHLHAAVDDGHGGGNSALGADDLL